MTHKEENVILKKLVAAQNGMIWFLELSEEDETELLSTLEGRRHWATIIQKHIELSDRWNEYLMDTLPGVEGEG